MVISLSEFCAKIGKPTNWISVYASRGQVVVTGKKPNQKVDLSVPANQHFLEKWTGKTDSVVEKPESMAEKPVIEPKKREKSSKKEGEEPEFKVRNLFDLKTKKQIEEYEKKIQLLETKISKANDEVIPREMASFLIKNYAFGVKGVWMNATRQFAMQHGVAMGLSKEQIIEFEKHINGLVNQALKDGAEEANRAIRRSAAEFAGKKGRGERND